MRAYLIAETTIKFTGNEFTRNGKKVSPVRSPYRDVYDEAKAKAQEAAHRRDCPRCGVCGESRLFLKCLDDLGADCVRGT